MSVKLPVEKLFSSVVQTGLCTRCGTCVGVCPVDNIYIPDPLGECLPEARDKCTSCGLCLSSCPGASVEFVPLEEKYVGEGRVETGFLGRVRSVYLAHAVDEGVRNGGASGGVVTAILISLLRKGKIDGAVVFGPSSRDNWVSEGRVARSEEEFLLSSQSRYYLSPMNTILSSITDSGETLAYVGLPCHVHGLRKAQQSKWSTSVKLSPVIGIYCGNNLYFEGTRAILKKLGIKSMDEVKRLSYREGEWPGHFHVETRDGVEKRISKLEFNQTIPFFINRRCLLCIDLTNELSDISVGDGWAKEGSSSGGWSIIITRTEEGERIVKEAENESAIVLEKISPEEAESMHSHAFDLKKTGASIRLEQWKYFGFEVPAYDRKVQSPSFLRKVTEFFISIEFLVASSAFGRLIFKVLPLGLTGNFFKKLRRVWIKRSKRDGGRKPY